MKKIISVILILCLTVCVGMAAVACVPDDSGYIKSITLDKYEITIDIGEEFTINYVLDPEDGDVEIGIRNDEQYGAKREEVLEDLYSADEGNSRKFVGVTAGTWIVHIRDWTNENMYAECVVTVRPPQGYTAQRGKDYKFVYPSNWTEFKTQVSEGTVAAYADEETGANVNIIAMAKDNSVYNVTSAQWEEVFKSTMQAVSPNLKIGNFYVEKVENQYYRETTVIITAIYSLDGAYGPFYAQRQIIRSSGDKTYALTVTSPRENLNQYLTDEEDQFFTTITDQFRTWIPKD